MLEPYQVLEQQRKELTYLEIVSERFYWFGRIVYQFQNDQREKVSNNIQLVWNNTKKYFYPAKDYYEG